MTRQKGEENLSDREVQILDLTDEWHLAEPGDDAHDYSLVGWIAHNLGISNREAQLELYGNNAPRDDGAVL